MPSTLSKIVLPGILFPLILLIGLICPLSVRADEPVPTSQPGEIYRAFNTKPQQLRDKSQRTDAERSSYLEDAPRFSSPTRQTAPLAALMDEKPVKGSPLREPARLFEGRVQLFARAANEGGMLGSTFCRTNRDHWKRSSQSCQPPPPVAGAGELIDKRILSRKCSGRQSRFMASIRTRV